MYIIYDHILKRNKAVIGNNENLFDVVPEDIDYIEVMAYPMINTDIPLDDMAETNN